MQRFFFHVHDGHVEYDRVGTMLPDLAMARKTAVQFAGELLRDIGRDFRHGEDWKVDVADEHGLTLFTILLAALDSPAVRRIDAGPLRPG